MGSFTISHLGHRSVCLLVCCLHVPIPSTSTLLLPLPRASAEGGSEKLIQFA